MTSGNVLLEQLNGVAKWTLRKALVAVDDIQKDKGRSKLGTARKLVSS